MTSDMTHSRWLMPLWNILEFQWQFCSAVFLNPVPKAHWCATRFAQVCHGKSHIQALKHPPHRFPLFPSNPYSWAYASPFHCPQFRALIESHRNANVMALSLPRAHINTTAQVHDMTLNFVCLSSKWSSIYHLYRRLQQKPKHSRSHCTEIKQQPAHTRTHTFLLSYAHVRKSCPQIGMVWD